MHRVLLFYFLCYRNFSSYRCNTLGLASVEELSALTSRCVACRKEQLFVEVGVGTLAYFCHTVRKDYAVLWVCEGSVFDYVSNCLEVFASHTVGFLSGLFYMYYLILSAKSQEVLSFSFLSLPSALFRSAPSWIS